MVDDAIDETPSEAMIDATLADTFPASDPPAWTLGRESQPRPSPAKNLPKTIKAQAPTLERKDTKTNRQSTSELLAGPKAASIKIVAVESFKEQVQEFSKGIAARAYEIYERRGREDGHALEDWIRAESELRCLAPAGILESPEQLEVNFRLPGVRADEIEIGIEPCRLFIRARKERGESQKSEEKSHTEQRFNSIFRALDLPDQVDPEKVTATFENGDLRLTLPRAFAQAPNSGQTAGPVQEHNAPHSASVP